MLCAKPARRFSHRVFRAFAVTLVAISSVFTAYFLYAQKQRLEADLLDRGRALAGVLASGARTAVYSENAILVQDTLQGMLERPEVLSAAVFTAGPTPLTSASRVHAPNEQPRKLTSWEAGVLQRPELRTGCIDLWEQDRAEVFCPVLIHTGRLTGEDLYYDNPAADPHVEVAGFVRLSLDRGLVRRALGALLVRSLLLVLVLLPLGTAAVYVLSRRVTEPLEQLTEAVRAFGAAESVREIPRSSDDEIGRLAEAFTGMIHDLAEREREQQRLAERLRVAQKMEAVGTLSQGISHDFKNILSTLKAAVHILQKGSPGNEFVLKYTDKIQMSLDRARDLVERLMTFSRTRQIEFRPVNLVALIARLAPMLREALGEGVRLEVTTPQGPVLVLGDAASLEQLLLNLSYNARDAMPEGGILCVVLETVPAAAPDGTGEALLTVRDTGVGMESKVRERLFEPFFSTKDTGAGMGLGLSIVHGIVGEHHGRIDVESEPGEGASFHIRLPLWREKAAVVAAVAEASIADGRPADKGAER